ncbi:hypothetical protein RSO41_04545 [Halomonas sp. I1]|uniref:hypothetical protein n=1 Tax=Halomonas sp. I1 TaxID=393536 RepID=UPI0028DE1D20|nr:hypothetical protein [Halomonas sp. I1]MDT8893916.1 hypothetical protein [Halomonas sp. I1]
MSTLYLHVGHGKTGSSFIQSSLALSQEVLLDKGINYPESNSSEKAKNGKITSGNGVMFDPVVSQSCYSDQGNVLISSEVLFHDIHDGKVDALLNKVDDSGFSSVKVLLFTRDLVEHAASSYQQMIKRGGSTISLENMFSRYKQPELVYNFIERLNKHSSVEITIRNYSNCRSNILFEVESWLGVERGMLVVPTVSNINRSMTRSELRFQKGVNNVLGRSGQLVSDRLCNSLPDIESEQILPDESVQESMLTRLSEWCEYVDSHAPDEHKYNHVTIPVSEESLSEESYSFTGKQIDTIADGLASEILKLNNQGRRQITFDPAHGGERFSFPTFSKKLEGKFGKHSADTLRDIALCFEASGDLYLAHYFMSLALKARPKGKLIVKKAAEYSSRLGKG